ncbi:glycosyltransferase family 4 protein [Psychroflexus halocasei]|uniref:Glycosyltransferase involved in cell wall bisynthesis n=1 Tax=Psychroflexus halocasei TaxID=908615 RepID=A0A1H4C3U9_9FLAO|nr:glycosyltransferase [Psychroflexus halocasei]SEA55024.1 Glycosyltransferase involved in cell wall bisynthesis [Psychroflexus halocasei]
MNFLIITHTNHYKAGNQYQAYAPYVREMNLWLNYCDKVNIVAPLSSDLDPHINLAYQHKDLKLHQVPHFSLIGFNDKMTTLLKLPKILKSIYREMKKADHIHLRCPGNMGLLGCIVQIFFPKIPKTAKYAGNWDPHAQQPWSYKLQKWILSNRFLTKNMQVLVYGNWPQQTKNVKAFFTATYRNKEAVSLLKRDYTGQLRFCFVGSLSEGKQPQLAFQFLLSLKSKLSQEIQFDVYGDGKLKDQMSALIDKHKANNWVKLHGNQPKSEIKKVLKESHFLLLPSKSEGWPKVVAEAMFWGCLPIVTPVSCVPWMLDEGQRGLLLKGNNIKKTVSELESLLNSPSKLDVMANNASEWSRTYTLDKFENEIMKLLEQDA